MATITYDGKAMAKKFRRQMGGVAIIMVVLFIGTLLFMAKSEDKKTNYYMQNVNIRTDSLFYDVFTGVFHHRFGRIWHESTIALGGKEVIDVLMKQGLEAERVLKDLNLYDQKKYRFLLEEAYRSGPDLPKQLSWDNR